MILEKDGVSYEVTLPVQIKAFKNAGYVEVLKTPKKKAKEDKEEE